MLCLIIRMIRLRSLVSICFIVVVCHLIVGADATAALAQQVPPAGQQDTQTALEEENRPKRGDVLSDPTPNIHTQLQQLRHAALRLPIAVGLASGVGLWMLAAFATGFVLLVLWIVESFEPKALQPFSLKVKAKDPVALRPKI